MIYHLIRANCGSTNTLSLFDESGSQRKIPKAGIANEIKSRFDGVFLGITSVSDD